ncbi:hypothetical protein DXG03_009763 [Asterophora parasitica]|uniref:Uncharacterized protein n=1 Tax=Asterophora parasitica TaxID=117018 RepID=A0A9P7G6C1_9AGAR|nr:hypothetical protein DXG03_009763 [Asterophora parasitica]
MATANTPDFNKVLYAPLAEIDPEVKNIIDKETWRQFTGLELIASEACFLSWSYVADPDVFIELD